MDMDGFEDANPFDNDIDRIPSASETSSIVLDHGDDHNTTDFFNNDLGSAPPPPPLLAQQSHGFPDDEPRHSSLGPAAATEGGGGNGRPPFPSAGSHRSNQVKYKTDYCCSQDRYLHMNDDFEVRIVDAQKTSMNSTSPYITYVIRSGTSESRHRYSEFESLRESLVKLYPTLIIPPIPSKQTIGDYAIKQGKAKEDAGLISRRKRMLETFLNRLAKHPILSNEHVFHRFLEGEVSWHEVLNSPPISNLPKNILKAPSHDPTDQTAVGAYAALPNPSAAHPLRRPDQRFLDSEAFTNKFANHMIGPMEKVTRRVVKRWKDYAQDQADLGAVMNGFSLNETNELASAIERTGQAVDVGYVSTTKLLQDIEQNWQEPLHEYSQFASIIKKLLAYRHQKHVQFEMTQDMLENKREQLEELEKSEREARRLEEALGKGRSSGYGNAVSPSTETPPVSGASSRGGEGESSGMESPTRPNEETPSDPRSSTYIPPHPGSNPAKRRLKAPGMGFLNALSYSLHGMMDVDPESARRNGITKTKESISTLEDALHLAAQDLKYSSSTIQADLDRFQRQKVADLREMGIAMAIAHRDWCKKNLEAWEEAKREIDKIPDHPNKAPTPAEPSPPSKQSPHVAMMAGPSSKRRDSTATVNGR